MSQWFQCWVKHVDPLVDQIVMMQRCDPILQRFGVLPCAPTGIPEVDSDGTIEVRGYSAMGFNMAKSYLKEQGFDIVREQTNY